MTDSESALVKPFRNVYRFFGAIVDAVYYFVASLVSPGGSGTYSGGRYRDPSRFPGIRSSGSGGPTIRTLRPPGGGGNAPNMSVGGCRSCM